MQETRMCVTYTRDASNVMFAWSEPVEMEPRQFWLPLSEEAVEQARKDGAIANRRLIAEDGVVVGFE